MTDESEKASVDTLDYVRRGLAGCFQLMNAWADPSKAFMNDFSRYDDSQILAEVYLRLARVHQEVERYFATDVGPMRTQLLIELEGIRAEINTATAHLAHVKGETPTVVRAGKRDVVL